MASTIEWTDDTWNPLEGCSPASPGCLHCYAAAVASRGLCDAHEGLTRKVKRRNEAGKLVTLPVFNGVVRLHPERLLEPVKRRKPTKWFVNSMSDLFHEQVPFEYAAAVLGIATVCPSSTFQILTKRAERAAAFFPWLRARAEKRGDTPAQAAIRCAVGFVDQLGLKASTRLWRAIARAGVHPASGAAPPAGFANVHLGVSCENQEWWDRRVRHLPAFDVGVRWVSIEPQIGPISIRSPIDYDLPNGKGQLSYPPYWIGWIVVGGESGPGARPFEVDWARSLVEQCRASSVPLFVKQLGERPFDRIERMVEWPRWAEWSIRPGEPEVGLRRVFLSNTKGSDPNGWPESLRVRQWPREVTRAG